MVPELLHLATEFYRSPFGYLHLKDPGQPLPDAFGHWLMESSNALAPAHIEATVAETGISAEVLQAAFLFLLRQTLLMPQADHYRTLGLSRDCSTDDLKRHHGILVRFFHPDRLPQPDEMGTTLTARINHAYQTLRDPEAREQYDGSLLPERHKSKPDDAAFFRRTNAAVPSRRPLKSRTNFIARKCGFVRLLLICGILLSLFFLARVEPKPPLLHMPADQSSRPAPRPHFLRQPDELVDRGNDNTSGNVGGSTALARSPADGITGDSTPTAPLLEHRSYAPASVPEPSVGRVEADESIPFNESQLPLSGSDFPGKRETISSEARTPIQFAADPALPTNSSESRQSIRQSSPSWSASEYPP
jgi:hypothetical protein